MQSTISPAVSHGPPLSAPASLPRLELVAILSENDQHFAFYGISPGQLVIPVDKSDLDIFEAFRKRAVAFNGHDFRHPRRGWRRTVQAALARGAAA